MSVKGKYFSPVNYILIALVGLSMVGMVFYNGIRGSATFAPLMDAAKDIKLEATTAHLWFEEILHGDRHEDMDTVWRHLDQADWYVNAMLEGGTNNEGTFIPLDDPVWRKMILEAQVKLREFRKITQERFANIETSGPGTDIDQRYDAVFTEFIGHADEAEARLQQINFSDLRRFEIIQLILLAVCLTLFAIFVVLVRRFGRLREEEALKETELELRNSQEQLRNLCSHLENIREEERTRISREVHDELGQKLTALGYDLSWLKTGFSGESEEFLEKTQSMSDLLAKSIKSVQRICTDLRPEVLDVLGISEAVEWQAQEFKDRTGIDYELQRIPESISLNPDLSTAVFRIFQETLTNVARHADASKVKISLTQEDNAICLQVQDNGKGINAQQVSHLKSLGLLGMKERAFLLGGKITFSGIQGKGTAVELCIPLMDQVAIEKG